MDIASQMPKEQIQVSSSRSRFTEKVRKASVTNSELSQAGRLNTTNLAHWSTLCFGFNCPFPEKKHRTKGEHSSPDWRPDKELILHLENHYSDVLAAHDTFPITEQRYSRPRGNIGSGWECRSESSPSSHDVG